MTRLIDADALRHSHCVECTYYYEDKCLEKNGGECDWDSIYHIDIAPTVDAVARADLLGAVEQKIKTGGGVLDIYDLIKWYGKE